MVNVGKYASPMEHLGLVIIYIYPQIKDGEMYIYINKYTQEFMYLSIYLFVCHPGTLFNMTTEYPHLQTGNTSSNASFPMAMLLLPQRG